MNISLRDPLLIAALLCGPATAVAHVFEHGLAADHGGPACIYCAHAAGDAPLARALADLADAVPIRASRARPLPPRIASTPVDRYRSRAPPACARCCPNLNSPCHAQPQAAAP